MAKPTKVENRNESLFIAALLKDARFLEERSQSFLYESDKPSIEVKNNLQSELSVAIGKAPNTPDALIVSVKLTVDSVDATDENRKIAHYVSVFRQIYEVSHIYGQLNEQAIPVSAIQPYVRLAMTVSAARAREAFARLGFPGIDIPINTDFEVVKA